MATPLLSINDYARLLFDEATDGLFIANTEGIYVGVNRSGHTLLGYEADELIGKPVTTVVTPLELHRLESTMQALVAGHVQTEFWAMRCKDGSTIDVELRSQLLSNGMVLTIVRTPGSRNEYEKKIQTSEAQLRSILRTVPDVILTVDRSGKILFINRASAPFAIDHVIGTSCLDFVPAESHQRVRQSIEHVFTSKCLDEYEVRSPPNEMGERGWSSLRAGPLLKDNLVVAVTLCVTDITPYKREAALIQTLLDRLRNISRSVPGMVFQFRRFTDGRVCFPYASEHVVELFGVSAASIQHDCASIFSRIHPDDLIAVQSALEQSANNYAPINHEFRLQKLDGNYSWLFGRTSTPVIETDGSFLWHGFLTDITERKQTEQHRARLEEQLMQAHKMESIGRLAGGVAHDFNNLLMAINGFTDIALDELQQDSPLRAYLNGIKNSAARGTALTQQLVAFARKKVVRPENVNLNTIINQMAPMIKRLMAENIDLTLDLDHELYAVKVDVGSMEQVLMNLIVNARDAMPNGGVLTVATTMIYKDDKARHLSLGPGDYVSLCVKDTGSGMTEEVRSRLFEPFFTTKAKGAGTGLGLAMCHGIVTQANGIIEAHSEVGVGTSINLYLPANHRDLTVPRASTTVHTKSTGSETILVVEDEPMILGLVSRALEACGYKVLTACDGVQALDVAGNTSKIDLLLTDVVMPRMGGLELAVKLHAQRPEMKIVFMSGYAENALSHYGELPTDTVFLQKPYQTSELTHTIRLQLDQRRY
jgi:PAS domain S-box-containing protein